MEFSLKGYKGKTVYTSLSDKPLTISGYFWCKGCQPVGEDGVPDIIYDLLEQNPDIDCIAISKKNSDMVYQRCNDNDKE